MTDSIFRGMGRDPRDVEAPAGSINAELLALPQQRVYTHDMEGRMLYFPRTDIVGVAYRTQGAGHWSVCVIDGGSKEIKEGSTTPTYPRGGHDISVSDLEMQTAVELEIEKEIFVEINGRMHLPASSLAEAKRVAELNEGQGHETAIVQTIWFGSPNPIPVAP